MIRGAKPSSAKRRTDGGDLVVGQVGCRATNRAFDPAPFLSHVSHERSGESGDFSRRAYPNRLRRE
jgi:hypothetical protein